MNKAVSNQKYMRHVQNTSPSKITYTFHTSSRFVNPKSFSPNKFYDQPTTKDTRAASIGYGTKTSFINRDSSDPGLYNTKSVFGKSTLRKRGTSFEGPSREKIYERLHNNGLPGPGKYDVMLSRQAKFYLGKSQKMKLEKSSQRVGPQTYQIKEECIERLSKYNGLRSIRIRTDFNERSHLDRYDNKNPGPGSYQPEKGQELQFRCSKYKGNKFGKSQKLKLPKTSTNLGPGQYKLFSVFGATED